jgi:hypothetical protein
MKCPAGEGGAETLERHQNGAAMDKAMDAYEVENRNALLLAEKTARLLQELAEIENRLELVERAIHRSLQD